jgi:acetyl-CoA synthetase
VTSLARDRGLSGVEALHRWSVEDRAGFWTEMIARLGIVFATPPDVIRGSEDPERPAWLTGARLNIVESCFSGDLGRVAIVYRREGRLHEMSLGELRSAVARFVAGYVSAGFMPGDRVAVAMAMNVESVIAYLGIVAAGGVVVSIADSFAADEIATRLAMTEPVAVVTQDHIERAGKRLPMCDKVVAAGAERCIVVGDGGERELRSTDVGWRAFLGGSDRLEPVVGEPTAETNILFSSGTTGDPKAIPWTQLTPIKAATDGFLHHDIHAGDVVAWPTNLGWMMGPWLIYASLINEATIALHDDAPTGPAFVEFVEEAGVTMLGVVPSLVAAWRTAELLADADWSSVRVLSSTGEASNPDDYRWLMERLGVPVIEYCGGTEIGGGYISGTVVEPAVPSTFTMPTFGLDVVILDDAGQHADQGELFLVPPSIGLSEVLLNRNHHEVYYAGLPASDRPLRRHGDQMERLANGSYRAQGRVDDTMNLAGIKVSSAEIERAAGDVPGVAELAAVALPPPGGGPSRLVIFAVPEAACDPAAAEWRAEMQAAIAAELNPLFKVHDVVVVDELPRTASQKVMRRQLRGRYRR